MDVEAGGNQTTENNSTNAPATTTVSSKDIMGGVKNRARLFMEAIMIMVCPVLLAILRGSDQTKSEENKKLGDMTCKIAGTTLEAGIIQFLIICLPKTVNNWVCGFSKVLIHLCVVLLMGLASVVMSLIGLKSLQGYVIVLVLSGLSSIVMGYKSWRKDRQEEMSKVDFKNFKRSLDASANFSAAVTAVLFLGLEALVLEGLMKGDLKRLLAFPLAWIFMTCGIGMFSMLLVSVHPLIVYDSPYMMCFLQGLSSGLGIGVCVVVYYFTGAALGEIKALGWLSLSSVPPFVWCWLCYFPKNVWCWLCYFPKNPMTRTEEEDEPASTPIEEEHEAASTPTEEEDEAALAPTEEDEPASLELTKITFAAFLAVSVISIDTSIGDCTWFLFPAALAIITGVQWRLMTHWKKVSGAVTRAANVACFMSHLCMACAVIPLALLAAEIVKKPGANGTAAAPLPSN